MSKDTKDFIINAIMPFAAVVYVAAILNFIALLAYGSAMIWKSMH